MKVTLRLPNGSMVDTDLTFEQLKELVGINGTSVKAHTGAIPLRGASLNPDDFVPDYAEFKKALTGKAKQFLSLLRQNPNGIPADHLADRLGFNTPVQIGGMAGGGMAKTAQKFGVKLEKVYVREIKFENGERKVIYRPGIDIELVA